ncbi:MAG: agmatinase family protein [Cystobacterineae bacterium]|nr:agmatinase family protein [Cystobacterineae bacterium]
MPTFNPDDAAAEDSGLFGLPYTPEEAQLVVIPIPFDATTSYGRGAALAPEAILKASHQVDLWDLETGKPYAAGMAMLDIPSQVQAWNAQAHALREKAPHAPQTLASVNALCEKLNHWAYETCAALLRQGKYVGVLGGDHSTPFGSIRAHAEKYPGMGVLHIDAHADLRIAFEGLRYSHASIMYNVLEQLEGVSQLVQVGVRDLGEAEAALIHATPGRIQTFFDIALAEHRMQALPMQALWARIAAALPECVYVSFDIDGLEPGLCPNTGTPVPGGLSFHEACGLLKAVVGAGKRVVGFDLSEVAPGASEWDANVGARILYKLAGWLLKSWELSP